MKRNLMRLIREGWLPTLIVIAFCGTVWFAYELAEALEPIAHGFMDRFDHMIGYVGEE